MATPRARRAPGTGSVYQQKGRSGWTVLLPYTDPVTGLARTRSRTVPSREDGETLLAEWLQQGDAAHAAATDRTPITVRDIARLWLWEKHPLTDRAASPGHVFTESPTTESTWRGYESEIATHVLPALGGVPMRDLTEARVRQFLAALPATPSQRHGLVSHSIVTKVYRRLHQLCTYAVRHGYAVRHPMLGMKAPARTTRSVTVTAEVDAVERALEVEEADRLIAWARATFPEHPDYAVRIRLGAETALRQAEACGLTWPQVDLRRRVVRVRQQLVHVPAAHGCVGEWGGRGISPCTLTARVLADDPTLPPIPARRCPQVVRGAWMIDADTKAHRRRTVPIGGALAEELAALRRAQSARHGDAASKSGPDAAAARRQSRYSVDYADLVFEARLGGHISKKLDNSLFHRGLAELGIDATGRDVHSLRHTAVTAMIRAGIPLPEVQQLAGHSSLDVLQRYYHAAITERSTAGDLLGRYLAAQRGSTR